ncbi:DUF6243 family protein [Streptomyces sp. SBT349]|uniref:DUF6243 family protein n=1 Tax=Streptomyces sp. SBT349 TaxID=1580539 RepID=UPI00066E9F40|nr:DUF6243 family protein [Streptomyces sp. SBT349]
MAKRDNNLLGIGGQRNKLSRADRQGSAPARVADRRAAADQKQELLRRMRERTQGDPVAEADLPAEADEADEAAEPTGADQAPGTDRQG